jgi:hypothetical protein
MKVLALIYADEDAWEALPDAEKEQTYVRYREFANANEAKLADGAQTASTKAATTVRVRDGQLHVTDGPFAETKEQLGGFFVFDVDSLEEAERLAAEIPGAATGAVELRPSYVEEAAP